MKAISAAAILVTAKAAEANQYNSYLQRNFDVILGNYNGAYSGRYDREDYGR